MQMIIDPRLEEALGILEGMDPDEEFSEDHELVASFDPSVYDDIEEMIEDFDGDIFYSIGKYDDEYWVTESVSLDITDQIDWDSLDYE